MTVRNSEGGNPNPHEIDALVTLFKNGHYGEIEILAEKMIARFPLHSFGWKAMGTALLQQGRTAESVAPLRKATELIEGDAQLHNNLGNAFAKLGQMFEAEASYRQALKINPGFVEAHHNLGKTLQRLGQPSEAEASYRQALELKPDFAETHIDLAHLLSSQGKSTMAISHYRKALDVTPDLIIAQEGLSNVLSRVVPGWHVPMMNEQKRNIAYYSALKSAITSESEVFEIGTGSGLLSMMSAKLGAKKVTSCEAEPLIAETAQRIVADNGYEDAIKVISKRSVQVIVGEDMAEKADILVSEIFSSDLLGEHVIPSIEDAKRRLLKPQARVIPAAGSIMVSLFGGSDIRSNLIVENSFGFNLQRFNSIVSKRWEIFRRDLNVEMLTEDVEAFRFDFENDSIFPSETKILRISIKSPGSCLGVILWMRLQMDKEIVYENHPLEKSSVSGWQHCVYLFPEPVDVKLGQIALISASHNRLVPWFSFNGIESA